MKRLFSIRTRDLLTVGGINYPGQGDYLTFPYSVDLTLDSQTAIVPAVANPAALPTSGLLYGMTRLIASTSEYVKYDPIAESGLYGASSGYWVSESLVNISTYLAATTDAGGCDRPLINILPEDVLYSPPAYGGSGSDSYPVQLWFSNGLEEVSGAAEPQGTSLTLQLKANGRNVTDAFSGRAYFKLLGYVRRSTGTLNTSIPTVGDSITWQAADSPVELPQDLLKGYAAAYELTFRFRTAELQSVIQQGAQITTVLYPEGLLGKLDSSWAIVGDVVLPDGDLMRIVPVSGGVKRLPGKCLVGGYRSPSVGETELIGLPTDQANLKITVSAALAGAIAYRLPSGTILTTEAVRAIVSTVGGTFTASPLSSALTIASSTDGIRLAIDYPTAVRSDYPDRIAGTTADFNVPFIYVYIVELATGNIYQLDPVAPTGTIDIITLSGGSIVGALPTSPSSDFCLFGYDTINATVQDVSPSSSTLPTGDYQVAIAYYFPDSNDRVTKISHSESLGCIPEFIALQDAIAQSSDILLRDTPPTSGDGTENDKCIATDGTVLNLYEKISTDTWQLRGSIAAPAGPAGPGAYTSTTASFVQSAALANISVAVGNTNWMAIGVNVYIETGGTYQVVSIASTTAVTLKNLDYAGNAASGTTIATNKRVTSAGVAGATGSAESSSGLALTRITEPPTTDAGKTALFASGDSLKIRQQSSGAVETIAILEHQNTFQKPVAGTITTIAPASTITLNLATTNLFKTNIEADTLIDNPIGIVNGADYELLLKQSSAGGYAVTFGSLWRFPNETAPNLVTTAGRVWIIRALARGGILYSEVKGWYEPPVVLEPIAFWDMEGSATNQVDSINGFVLSGSGCSLLSGTSGNAIAIISNTSSISSTDTGLSLGVVAWRIKFDFYIDAEPSSGSATSLIMFGNEEWTLSYRNSVNCLRLAIFDDVGGGYTIDSTVALSVGTWYSIVLSCNPGVDASIKVDTNAADSTSIGATGTSTDFQFAIKTSPVSAGATKYRVDNLEVSKA
jgi:hypothetical protein